MKVDPNKIIKPKPRYVMESPGGGGGMLIIIFIVTFIIFTIIHSAKNGL